jgi:CRP/FNR family transcriptional regulator
LEFASPGDVIGLGFLEAHACDARAILDTRLVAIPLDFMADLASHDPALQVRLDAAIEREFEYLRACTVKSGQQSLYRRVAAFLVSASRINQHEGRDPMTVVDTCPSGFVADLLGTDVKSLGAVLVDFERRGLIEPCVTGLRLKDVRALEFMAARSALPSSPPGRRPACH